MTSLCAAESTVLRLETLQKNTDALCLFHTHTMWSLLSWFTCLKEAPDFYTKHVEGSTSSFTHCPICFHWGFFPRPHNYSSYPSQTQTADAAQEHQISWNCSFTQMWQMENIIRGDLWFKMDHDSNAWKPLNSRFQCCGWISPWSMVK